MRVVPSSRAPAPAARRRSHRVRRVALWTLQATSDRVEIVVQAIATRVEFDRDNGRITGITLKRYFDIRSTDHETVTVRGKLFVLAAHAVENAKLLLASGAANSSGLVGRNLMDHPVLLVWGLAPEPVWPFRGPVATSGIEGLRYGQFRRDVAALRIEIGNDGWTWPADAPVSDVTNLVDAGNLWGAALRQRLAATVPRQLRFGMLVEQLPEWSNRVTIDPAWFDRMGNYRPVVSYNLSDYTRAGFALAKQVSDRIFRRAGIEDFTTYSPSDPGYFNYEGQGYVFQGAGHFMGTHCMGSARATSVVDRRQRAWDHENLYLVGCGNMVTGGTSNPTLTAAALSLWAAENMLQDLDRGGPG